MKKVMFMLAAVACAASVQAATIKWGTGTVKLPDGTTNMTKSNVSLYFWSENIADPWASTKVTKSGEGDTATYAVAASDAASYAVKTGIATITGNTSTYSNGDTAYGAVILTYDSNNDGKIGIGDYYMTGTGSYELISDVSRTPNLAMSSWTQITASSSGGTTPVPEPTSGLLMLLGMAGLALKRKRC